MPQANDAELTRLFTASVSKVPAVEDNEPNTPAPGGTTPASTIYLVLEAVAGNVRGGDGSDYYLYLDAVGDTPGAPALQNFALHQEFKNPPWQPGGMAGNFISLQTFSVTVPAGARGHVYHYEGRLVSLNNDVVSFIQSNRFILV